MDPVEQAEVAEGVPPRVRRYRLRKWLIGAFLTFAAVLLAGIAVLNSPIGHRYVAERIARVAPASGMRITIGRIDGSLYGKAVLHDVTLSDSQGPFLRVPLAELDWRPFAWFSRGLDVRELTAHRGVLLRRPRLKPGDPNAPLLPNFDIRIDKFVLDRFTIAPGVAGRQARRVDLAAKVDVRRGRALIVTDGRFDSADKLHLLVDAQPSTNKLRVELDYQAPQGGVLAGLAGAKEDLRARIVGKGGWQNWTGALLVEQPSTQLAALKLTARSGAYSVLGLVHPDGFVSGLPKRLIGDTVALGGTGTLTNSVLQGRFGVTTRAFVASGEGKIDLGKNAFDGFTLTTRALDPKLLSDSVALADATFTGRFDGPFQNLTLVHKFSAREMAFGTTRIALPSTQGTARRIGSTWTLPLNLVAARVITGNAEADRILIGPRLNGTINLAGNRLWSNDLLLAVPGLGAQLSLAGDLGTGNYALAGPVVAKGFVLPNLGRADARADIVLRLGANRPWLLDAKLAGRMVRVDNATLTSIAGTNVRFAGNVSIGGAQALLVRNGRLDASRLSLALAGRVLPDGRTTLTGRGRHADYGPFTVEAMVAKDGPRAVLVFASPLPAAGLKDVRVALSPIPQGFRIETQGGSRLGPFDGVLGLFSRPGGPTRIEIERLTVAKTDVNGTLTLVSGGADGLLALHGGGVDGTIRLAPRGGAQGFDVALTAKDARFGGPAPLSIAQGTANFSGTFGQGGLTLSGNTLAAGIQTGNLFIGRLAAQASVANGRGKITASLAGRRGSRFNLQLVGDLAPDRIAVLAAGDYAGRKITMPRRAVLTTSGAGWALAPTEIDFGGGRIVASGTFGNGTALNIALSDMPLSLGDIAMADLGLGGTASGVVNYHVLPGSLPTGDAAVVIKGLTRSGLVLTSRPIDLALVGRLGVNDLEARAVVKEGGQTRGRLQARIANLAGGGGLAQRLNQGSLFAQLRYNGPADALWRLIALEAFDLNGPVSIAADATGSLANPTFRGTVASDGLRLQSALIGADIQNLGVRGSFAGARLELSQFSGKARNGGTVAGSGSVDLTNLGVKAPSIDLKLAANNALLIARDDLSATVTGPIRVLSDGINGTIAGRLAINKASWQLGRAASAAALPTIKTREINLPPDLAPVRALSAPWRYLIDVSGGEQIAVRGLGLDSEWGAQLKIRGTTAAPTILGRVDLVRGGYEFAGKRFDLTRGIIRFDGENPPNPRLDIAAETQVTGLTARVTVTGSSLVPVISFSSTPALPEEELLARLLFGDSIATISPAEALQLGAALASLRGGGGIDPINKLRSAIGLDRLRIIPADEAKNRGTSIAVGKYLGRKFYAEIITDGRGYSATQLEFRVTNWLSILGSISTVGRQSLNVKVQKDY